MRHLPDTPVKTRTAKGEHWFYRYPSRVDREFRFKNSVKLTIEGEQVQLDVRADGGYDVAPGSVHTSGARYEMTAPWIDVISDMPEIDPELLGRRCKRPDRQAAGAPMVPINSLQVDVDARAQARRYLSAIPGAVQGQGGDQHTFNTACKIMRGFNLSESDAYELLCEWNTRCVPPWSEHELQTKIAGASRYGGEALSGRLRESSPGLRVAYSREAVARNAEVETNDIEDAKVRMAQRYPLTDSGHAEWFAFEYGGLLRFNHTQGRWLFFNRHRWRPDTNGKIVRLAKQAIRKRAELILQLDDISCAQAFNGLKKGEAIKKLIAAENQHGLEACLRLAQSEAPITSNQDDPWDADPWLLGCTNGILDLRTATLRPGVPADWITMSVAVGYHPSAACPRWERFVAEVFGGDEALTAWVQKAVGYSLTGDTSEQVIFVAYGKGSNGKGVLFNTLQKVLGDYGSNTAFSTFELHQRSSIPNDIAALAGRRFVTASETNDGTRFNEARIKAISGCDPMTARVMHSEFFTFIPKLKLWLAVNHKPVVRDDSYGFWRRLRLIPFPCEFSRERGNVDSNLQATLASEAEGIFAWAVRGCLAWQREGLGEVPEAVEAATAQYQAESDPLREFFDACCITDAAATARGNALWQAYTTWADTQGLRGSDRLNARSFGIKLSERFTPKRDRHGKTYVGIGLRDMLHHDADRVGS
jgi:putative DNA primase/helicase